MNKLILAVIASFSVYHVYSAQELRLTTDEQILRGLVHAEIIEINNPIGEKCHKAYSDAVNSLRKCDNYAADRETIDTLKVKMSKFYEDQGFGKDYIYKVPVSVLSCDVTGIDLRRNHMSQFQVGVAMGEYNKGVAYANECKIFTSKQQRFNVFKTNGWMTGVPLGFSPKSGQKVLPDCSCSSSDGIKVTNVKESIADYFVHESGHWYYYSNDKGYLKKESKVYLNKEQNIRAFQGMSIISEIPAWLFEFRYRITREDDLKTGDAYCVVGRIARMLSLEYESAFARCSNFALSIASLENVKLKALVDKTIAQLKPIWSGTDVAKLLENCEIVDDAEPADYGITFDKKQNRFVMKYNADENLKIMKRWLNKIGYEDADATVEKIKAYTKEEYAVLDGAK